MEQEQKPHRQSFVRELVPTWRPTREQMLWAIRIMLVLVVMLGILTLVGLPFDVTLWDWLDLLIIPIVLAIGGYLFTRSENRATRVAAEQRAQDEALQAYLDQMSQLLLDKDRPLRLSERDHEVRTLARARTLTVLAKLDGERKGNVVQFLYESGLIVFELYTAEPGSMTNPVVDLRGADLSEANLSGADLRKADLGKATLTGAILRGTHLIEASLWDTNLSGADLRGAMLREALLHGADLSGADLTAAKVSDQQLVTCRYLAGATMPNGQKYQHWRKSKGSGEDEENSGPQ